MHISSLHLFSYNSIFLLQDGKILPIQSTPNIPIESEPKKSQLSCKSAVRADTGEYYISVENEHGSDTASMSVVVLSEYNSIVPKMVHI